MNLRWTSIILSGWIVGMTIQAEAVDPLNAEAYRLMLHAEGADRPRWLPTRIQRLEEEQRELLALISALPQFDPALVPNRLGYHSGYAKQDGELSSHQLTVHFVNRPVLAGISMVPAMNPRDRHDSNYAFPRRFRIEVLESERGVWSEQENRFVQENLNWVEVVNWMGEDFPDPGRYPVFFRMPDSKVAKIRLTVPDVTSELGHAFYALNELYLFQGVDGQVADNMSVWGSSSIERFEVSDSFSLQPFWDVEYLYDGLAGLGVPLSEERVEEGQDFLVRFGEEASEPVQIVLDLGTVKQVGRVEFWPTEAPDRIVAPLYAFPGTILVELSDDPDFKRVKRILVDDARAQMYHNNILRIMCDAYDARYIRFTIDALREDHGQRVLGIGEISVSEHGQVFSEGCEISASGIPEHHLHTLPRLVDGNCRGRRILSETEWIMGLAQRRPLDRRLNEVNQELRSSREAWRSHQLRLSIWGGSLLCVGLLVAMGLQRLQRRRILKGLKVRITRDLHDEVGSSLGGLSLTSGGLANMTEDAKMKSALDDLSLMAREAASSLREVVWVTDQDVIRLPALIEKMQERAERILSGVDVVCDIHPDLPDLEVSLSCKRHLIMFFREAVHNCARHAGAGRVMMSVGMDSERMLEICLEDDGCGFDVRKQKRGWGVDSMRQRAEELSGVLNINSTPGKGTRICLILPLTSLQREPTKAYNTSN
ncbi:Sensor histidine kinase LiaS [Pontiella desulfatans]|uniref:histidine kinase n=1 Tax=Pontiella desulfatans TaxID=2750659 RepID=A0A6C2UAL4_PONDE|nr:ATP-binding protein [Pontiella desulfatans]VGO16414.1 Sensor histidine kinase LiaS [Pontiella desulfatans]